MCPEVLHKPLDALASHGDVTGQGRPGGARIRLKNQANGAVNGHVMWMVPTLGFLIGGALLFRMLSTAIEDPLIALILVLLSALVVITLALPSSARHPQVASEHRMR